MVKIFEVDGVEVQDSFARSLVYDESGEIRLYCKIPEDPEFFQRFSPETVRFVPGKGLSLTLDGAGLTEEDILSGKFFTVMSVI